MLDTDELQPSDQNIEHVVGIDVIVYMACLLAANEFRKLTTKCYEQFHKPTKSPIPSRIVTKAFFVGGGFRCKSIRAHAIRMS